MKQGVLTTKNLTRISAAALILILALSTLLFSCRQKTPGADSSGTGSGGSSNAESSKPSDNSGSINEPDDKDPDIDDEDDWDFDNSDGNADDGDFVFVEDEKPVVPLPDVIKDVNDYSLINAGSSRLKLMVKGSSDNSANHLQVSFSDKGKGSYVFQDGDYLEYFVMMSGNTRGTGLVEVESQNNIRGLSKIDIAYDTQAIKAGKGVNLGVIAAGKWYHRQIRIPETMIGTTLSRWSLYQASGSETTITWFDDIKITNGGKDKLVAFENGELQKNTLIDSAGIESYALRVGHQSTGEIIPQGDYIRMVVQNESFSEGKSSYMGYVFSQNGKGRYKVQKGDRLVYKLRAVNAFTRGGSVNIHFTDNTWLTDVKGVTDQNSLSADPSENISGLAGEQWYYRSVELPAAVQGKTVDYFTLCGLDTVSGRRYEIQLADVKIISGEQTKLLVYGGGAVKNGGVALARNAKVAVEKNHSNTNIGSPSGDVLKLRLYPQSGATTSSSVRISSDKYTFQAGDCLEYDINYDNMMPYSGFGVQPEMEGNPDSTRFSGWRDQNAISGSPGVNISSYTAGGWYHRRINLSNSAGETAKGWLLQCEKTFSTWEESTVAAQFDNIRITRNGKTVLTIYENGKPKETTVTRRMGSSSVVSHTPYIAPAPLYSVPDLSVPADDVPVIAYNVRAFGAQGNGVTDDTSAIQAAIFAAEKIGGGTVFIPSGKYRVNGVLGIPAKVHLRGEWQSPAAGGNGRGTILMAYSGRGDESSPSFIILEGGGAVSNLSVWYPEQDAANPVAYPWTLQNIFGNGGSVKNITLYNSYKAVKFGPNINQINLAENVYGTVLHKGGEVDNNYDTPCFFNWTLTPDIWANSGLPGAPSGQALSALRSYLVSNLEVIRAGRADFLCLYGITADYAKIGLRMDRGENIDPASLVADGMQGAFVSAANLRFTHVNTGIQADFISSHGVAISGGVISATEGSSPAAVRAMSTMINGNLGIAYMKLSGTNAVLSDAKGTVSLQTCEIGENSPVSATDGTLMVNGTLFRAASRHISLGAEVKGASIVGNSFDGGAKISSSATNAVIDHTARTYLAEDGSTTHDFRSQPAPGTKKVFLATDYGVKGDMSVDCTAALQRAIDAAGAAGGGIVYIPGGKYEVRGRLNVKSGVELRGAYTSVHHSGTAATLIRLYAGRNDADGAAAVTLQSGAGINGLDFFYPEQLSWNIAPYSWTVQSRGPGAYVANSGFVNSWRGVDFGTYNNDRHYIADVGGCFLEKGIFAGNSPTYGTMRNIQAIIHYWTPDVFYGGYPVSRANEQSNPIYLTQAKGLRQYIFGDCKNESLLATFNWGGAVSLTFQDQGGGGFKGKFVLPGADGAFIGLDVSGAEKIDFTSAFMWTHNWATERSYARLNATNTGAVNIRNGYGGSSSITTNGFYVEKGTLNVQQFYFGCGSEANVVNIKGGTVNLAGLVTMRYNGAGSKDLLIGSGANAVNVTGWLSVGWRNFLLQNDAGGRYQAVGVVNVE